MMLHRFEPRFSRTGHQITAKTVFEEKDEFFLFITAPTGAGKTDSWVIPALTSDKLGVVFALYPTNALAEDQYKTICALRDELAPARPVEFINAERLGVIRDESSFRITKGEAFYNIVEKIRNHNGIIITNPDIFVLALKDEFRYPYLAGFMRNSVQSIIFDEFHLYNLKQSDFLLFLLDDLISSDNCSIRKFVFLSATPSREIIHKIEEVIGGEVIIADEFCNCKEIDKRIILPPVHMTIHPGRKFSCGEIILQDFQKYLDFFKGVRTAIILDSAIEVTVLSDFLRKNTSYKICEQSGFRKDSFDRPFDILVGNKAIEVGIDFKGDYAIQKLIFSAFSESEFLQRFGRLRNPDPAASYEAICFLPHSVYSYFSRYEHISRNDLKEGLAKTMQDSRVYTSFRWRWGYLEAWEYLCMRAFGTSATKELARRNDITKTPHTGGMPTSMRRGYLADRIEKIYGHYFIDTPMDPAHIKKTFKRLEHYDDSMLYCMKELSSFRGGSFSLAIYYEQMKDLKKYDLFFLLRWTEIEIMERTEFIKKIPDFQKDKIRDIEKGVIGYAWVTEMRDTPRSVSLQGKIIDQIVMPDDARLPGIEYGIGPVTSSKDGIAIKNISLLFKNCIKEGIFCRYLDLSAYQSRKCYDLGDYARIVSYNNGSFTIGPDAFIADCAIAECHNKSDSLPGYPS